MTRRVIRRALVVSTAFVFSSLPSASADVVTTKDGLVVEGTATREKDGSVTVQTPDGEVRLGAADVATVTTGEGPRTAAELARKALGKSDATAHFRLALQFDAQGFPDLAQHCKKAGLDDWTGSLDASQSLVCE